METIQVAPVPDSQKNTLGVLARDIRTALSYLSFYSADSPFVVQSLQKLQKGLQKLQDSFGTIVLHLKEGQLCLNDTPLGDTGDLPRFLKEKNLLGLEIPGGFSAKELESRLKQLTLPAAAAIPGLESSSRIRPLSHSVLLEILPKADPSPSENSQPFPAEVETPSVRDTILKNLPPPQRFAPPAPFADLDALQAVPVRPVEKPQSPKPTEAPAVDEALLSFVAEAWQYSLTQRKSAEASPLAGEATQSFEKLFFRLLDRMEKATPDFSEISRWFKAPAGEWMEGRTTKAMLPLMECAVKNGWTSVLFDPATEGLVGDCLAHWGAQGKEDLVEKSVTRLSEGLCGDLLERQLALAHLQDARPWVSNPGLLEKVLTRLNALLSSETLPGPYQSALLLAWDLTDKALSSGKEAPVLTLLSTLHFHADEENGDFPERSRIARHWLFERSNPGMVRRLVLCAFKAGHLSHFPLLEEMAAPLLVEDFLAAEPQQRAGLFPLFSEMKESLRSTLAEVFAEGRPEEQVAPLLPLLRVSGLDAGLSLQLCSWVSRGSRTFRTELLSLIEEIADPAGGPALRLALFDDNAETAALAARVMGKTRYKTGVPVLLKALHLRREKPGEHEVFLTAACRSLGELGDEKAIPFLQEAARRKFLLRGRTYPESVRLAAIEALSRIDRPEVWRFLETLAAERNESVQETLERITRERTESLLP